MEYKSYALTLCLLFFVTVKGYRILGLFPIYARSHFNFNNAIMKSLVAAGHEVVVATPFSDQPSLQNYTIIDLSNKRQSFENQLPITYVKEQSMHALWDILNVHREGCNALMNLPEIQNMFQSEEKLFDAIFIEVMILHECFTPLAAKWKIPVIGTISLASSSVAEYSIGLPRFPSVIQSELGSVWPLSSMCGRLINSFKHLRSYIMITYSTWIELDRFYEAHRKLLTPYSEYRKLKPSLIFFNSHFTILPRELNPNTIEIGGIHISPTTPLPLDIQKFIDDAKSGVIVFTLGSVLKASTLPNETVFAFKEAFRTIPQRIIWKYEDEMEDIPENVLILPWLPQTDILSHDNVKAFISHCGMSTFYEVITYGKPVIATPIWLDQLHLANILLDRGVGIMLNILNPISKDTILNALNSIINDTRYSLNMKRLSHRFKNRPMSPEKTVIYWTEYIIGYGGAPHLQTPATKLYWFQYLLIDILACTLLISLLGMFIIKRIFKKVKILFSKPCSSYNVNVDKKLS